VNATANVDPDASCAGAADNDVSDKRGPRLGEANAPATPSASTPPAAAVAPIHQPTRTQNTSRVRPANLPRTVPMIVAHPRATAKTLSSVQGRPNTPASGQTAVD
jgi:hypothetical protein